MRQRYAEYKDSGIQWIGEVPEHWKVERLGHFFSFHKGLNITKADLTESGNKVISYGQIHSKLNSGTKIDSELFRFVPDSFLKEFPQSILQKNDFLFADTSEDFSGCGNCVFVDKDDIIFAGYHTLICRPANYEVPQFLAYLFLSTGWRYQLQSNCHGVKVFSITRDKLKNNFVLIPSFYEQNMIVKFLDVVVDKIDTYIAEKETEIEKLGVLKQSVISHAVTKGINPKAKMKDSGIKWIGEIPESWEVKRLFSVALEHFISNKNINHQNLLSLSYGKIIPKNINCLKGLLPASFDTYQIVEPGNIILRFTDLQNDHHSLRVGFVNEEGIITSAYLCLENRNNINSKYLYLFLHVNDIHKVFYGMGNGLRQSLDFPEFRKLPVLLPSLEEQQLIVDFLDRKVREIDDFITGVREQIEKLKIYKQRLISDVVTGKINVCHDIQNTLAQERS